MRPLAAVSIRAAAAELVAHAEGSGPRSFAPPAPFGQRTRAPPLQRAGRKPEEDRRYLLTHC
jgi:hypothetical protein